MMIFIFFLSFFVRAEAPGKWENAKSIVERHEFYQNDEEILKPKDSWQILFALTFLDSHFGLSKDCVYYRVPGDEPGKMKVKTLPSEKDCASEVLSAGDTEWDNISRLSFSADTQSVSLSFVQNHKQKKWHITVMKDWKKPEAKLLLSSADFKSPSIIYLATAHDGEKKIQPLKDGTVCHDISSDCTEKAPSQCRHCEYGWQEIPNGCLVGPKVCGAQECGGKNRPACRRGMNWQRKEIETFDCRLNASFAWCSGKLTVFCDGDRAYCR